MKSVKSELARHKGVASQNVRTAWGRVITGRKQARAHLRVLQVSCDDRQGVQLHVSAVALVDVVCDVLQARLHVVLYVMAIYRMYPESLTWHGPCYTHHSTCAKHVGQM